MMILVRTAHSREFVCVSCMISQNINILHLHEVNSKFQNNRHYGCEVVDALCFILSHIT